MRHSWFKDIFQKGSTTYFYSSLFFPRKTLKEVTKLYSYVRVADDFVDAIPQQKKEFEHFAEMTMKMLSGKPVENPVIHALGSVVHSYKLDPKWITEFLEAMRSDLSKSYYATMVELDKYMYGSAEVVGLMMAKIMQVPETGYASARLLGKSMQYINFLRDVNEDLSLGRQYIPQEVLESYRLSSLEYTHTYALQEEFIQMYRDEIKRFLELDDLAREGFAAIPKRFRVAVKTASDMYRWTAKEIAKDPFIIYEKKVKPKKSFIIWQGIKNIFIA